ncbi:MAG: OmpA/MotB family protein [Alphaproteobacteria bacterium]|jgi:chemotaxis protein MotB
MSRRKLSEPVAEDEEWMTTYADAITLLMAFFVMLVNFSKIDIPRFEDTMAGIKSELGKDDAPKRPLFTLNQNLDSILENANIDPQDAEVSFDDQGVVVEFASRSFFKPRSAEMLPGARKILSDVAYQVVQPPYDLYYVDVEGHTDDVPINTPKFPSNWELSTLRATGVVRFLIEIGLESERLKAAGYADVLPKVPNLDLFGAPIPENRAENRRIVIRLHP